MNKYEKVAKLVLKDLRSRRGFDLDLDDETIDDIVKSLAKIIAENV